MNVLQIPNEVGRFYVESRSRTDITHLVDLMFAEEIWRKPQPRCSCEHNFAKGLICAHIEAVVEYEQKRLGLCPSQH